MVVVRLGSAARRALLAVLGALLLVGALRVGLGRADGALGFPEPIRSLPVRARVVALTFDVSAAQATGLARALADAGLPATAFVSGRDAAGDRTAVAALAGAGAEVESLGWDPAAPATDTAAALRRAAAALAADTGTPPLFYRPAGAVGPALLRAARSAGLAVVGATASAATPAGALAHLAPGAILTLPAGLAATSLAELADGLRLRGYEPVTLEALLAVAEGAANVSLASLP